MGENPSLQRYFDPPNEIELRQQQYEYYRNMLLNFPKQED